MEMTLCSTPSMVSFLSEVLVERVMEQVRDAGYEVGNVDSTVIAQVPRLGPFRSAMAESVAKQLDVPAQRVNVKVTSTDRLGALGRGEGMAAQAVVLLVPRSRA